MVSYDIYKNRIQKIAAVKNFIVRFRILFIILAAVIIAAISAFLIMKGMVVGGITLPEKIVYGDTFAVEGSSALFSDLSYEYAPVTSGESTADGGKRAVSLSNGSEELVWSSEKPDKAGSYLVRTVTTKSFGIISYGNPVSFKIEPKQVEFLILDETVVYGSNPDEYVFNLVGDDKLIATGLKYDFESFETTITNVCANSSSVKVVDKYGNDVTYCYNIITPEKEIRLVEREITVTPASAQFTYDGSPIEYESAIDEATRAMLGEGDRAVIDTVIKGADGEELDGAPAVVGKYTVEISSVSIFKGEIDVTERYGLTFKTSEISVVKRKITITTNSAEREYDGTALSARGFTVDGFAEGSGHVAVADEGLVSIVYAGKAQNKYTYKVNDRNGADVTENYEIGYNYGELRVLKRKVTLTTPSAEKVYDGTPLSLKEGYSLSPLAVGDTELIGGTSKITNAGESENAFTYIITDGAGNDVTENYEVTCAFGTLKVTPRPITITTGSAEKIYDGVTLYGTQAVEGLDFSGLVAGHECVAYDITSLIDAGSVKNATRYRIYSDGAETTSNYSVAYVEGSITITKRPLEIFTGSGEKVYDGTPLTGNFAFDGLAYVGLADGDRGVIDTVVEITEAGSVSNTSTYKIYSDRGEVTNNYIIEYKGYGTMTVIPRPLTIYTGSSEREYDGTPFVYTEGYFADNLASNQNLAVDETRRGEFSSVTEVNEELTENVVYYVVRDNDGEDVTKNYAVNYVNGYIRITPFTVRITTSTSNRIYDGTPYSDTSFDFDRFTDCGHKLILDDSKEIAKVTYFADYSNNNVFTVKVVDGEGKDVSYNYSLGYSYGTISIALRSAVITTGTDTKVYDGTPLYGHSETAVPVFEGFVGGETFTATEIYSVIYVPDTEETKKNATRYSVYSDGTETTANYDITYVYGDLTITKRPLTITTATDEKEYDGTPLNGNAGEDKGLRVDNLVAGETLSAFATTMLTDVKISDGKAVGIDNQTTYRIYSGGFETTENYDITYVYGTLTVTPREIKAVTATSSNVYDGNAYHDYRWSSDRLLYEKFGHRLFEDETRAEEFSSVTYVSEGEVTNVVYYVVHDADGNDISFNYSIDYSEKGKIWITKRPVSIITATDEKEYDGTPLYGDSETAVPTFYNLVVRETWKAYGITEITEVKNIGGQILGIENQTEYRIYSGERETTDNYTIEYLNGELTITPRVITVTTATDEWEYDGTAHQNYGRTAERLLESDPFFHTLALDENRKDEFVSVTEVNEGKVPNTVYYIVKDSAGKDISYNYSISYVWGEISVAPRVIKVVTSTGHWVYDGNAHQNLEVFSVDRLLKDMPFKHTLVPDQARSAEFSSVTYFTEGEKDNAVYYIVEDSAGKDISNNYSIDYSEKGKIWITKRPLTITTATDEKEYDGTPLYGDSETAVPAFDNLVGGETRIAYDVAEITDVKNIDGKTVGIDNETAYRIYSGGLETTENYEIKYVYGTLTVTPRPLAITTATDNKEYDGTPLYGDSETAVPAFDNLVGGESWKAYDITEITEVKNIGGEIARTDNQTKYRIYSGERETTGNYTITYIKGTLKITPRNITVTTATSSNVYDGTAYHDYGWTAQRLLEGEPYNHTLAPDETRKEEFASVTNVLEGLVRNTVYYIVKDGAGKDISYNYSITYIKGDIRVTPRPITVTTGSAHKEYDATPLYKLDGYRAENLVLDHEIVLDMQRQAEFAYALNVFDGNNGLVENQLYFKVRPAGSEDDKINKTINANYSVEEYVLGKLYITRKSAEITTNSRTKTYDGQPLYGVADPDDSVFEGFLQTAFVAVNSPEITKAGWVKNDIQYKVYDGELETTENYDITYRYGTLTVTALAVTITTGTQSKEFDGQPFSYTAGYKTENLVEGHYLEVDESKAVASVTYVTEGEVENKVHYVIKDENATDVTASYTVTYVWGKISRTQRGITVTTATTSNVYDGTAYHDYGWTADRLLEGEPYNHTLVPDETRKAEFASVTNVLEGKVQNTVYYIVKDGAGNDVSLNYSIKYDWGTISIDPRPITVTTNDAEKTYDGRPLSDGGAKDSNLVSGHTLKLSGELQSITDAGVRSNVFTVDVYNGEKKVTDNYDISYVYGELKINPKPITVELFDTQNVTYGTAVPAYPTGADNYANYLTAGLVGEERLEITVKYIDSGNNTVTPKNAGKYAVVIDTAVIHGGQGNAGNYKISQLESVFEILKKNLTVTLIPADTKEYDGNAYAQSSFSAVGLVYNERLDIAVKYYSGETEVSAPVDAGEYRIVLNTLACTIDGTVNANVNYSIYCEDVYYTITPRKLTVAVENAEREYNAVAFDYFAEGYTLKVENLLDGRTFNGKVITADEDGNPISAVTAGIYQLLLDRNDWSVIGDKKTNYALAGVTDGVLEITKRNIVVTADDRTGDNGWEYSGSRVPDSFLSYSSVNANGADEGFVNGDDAGLFAVYSFTQNGNGVTPIARGTYTVSVLLQDSGYLAQNYSITYKTGELQIINRFVTVEIDNIAQLEYDGTALDWSLLHFTSYHRGNRNEAGFIDDDVNLYKTAYTVTYIDGTEYGQGEIINAGNYTVTVELTPIGADPGYIINYIYKDFFVDTREITVKVTYLDRTVIDYDKSLPDTSAYGYSAFYAKDGSTDGFVSAEDADKANPVYAFYNGGEKAEGYLNAGENRVYVEGFTSADGLIGRNYTVIYVEENYQTLEVKPILLVIAPQDKETLYEGEPLALLPTEYSILNSNSLMAGDILEAVFDYELQPNIRSQRVQIISYEIYDRSSRASVKDNYEVYYSYDREAEALADYKQSNFIGKLSYNKRTVTVRQIPPEAYRNGVIYNGSIITIESDGNPLFEVIGQTGEGFGLLDGNELYVLSAATKNKPGVNNEWLKLRVTDADDNDITWAYDIVIEQDEDTFITVYAIPLTITVNAEVAGNYDGYLLADDEFTVTGNVLADDIIEVTMHVSQDGKVSFTAEVFQRYGAEGEKRRDRGDYYSVTITQQQTISALNGMEAQQ